MSEPAGTGTPTDPWRLQTPPLTSEFTMHRDVREERAILVCTVGKTVLLYDARCLEHLHSMLKERGDWVELGSADEQKGRQAWNCRSVGALLRQSSRRLVRAEEGIAGTFGMYIPPFMELLGLAEVEHNPRSNRMRAA